MFRKLPQLLIFQSLMPENRSLWYVTGVYELHQTVSGLNIMLP